MTKSTDLPPRPEHYLVIAEMNTHAFMFRGAGETREQAEYLGSE